jgi:hypothetical protein
MAIYPLMWHLPLKMSGGQSDKPLHINNLQKKKQD